VVSVTVPPDDDKLFPLASFSCTVIVDVLAPFAVKLPELELIVVVETSAEPAPVKLRLEELTPVKPVEAKPS
jgi:hypothetical protein